MSAVPSLEANNNVKSIKTTLFHSNVKENLTTFPPPSSIMCVMHTFPKCVNNTSNNQGDKETQHP